jgi:hypothetical protein
MMVSRKCPASSVLAKNVVAVVVEVVDNNDDDGEDDDVDAVLIGIGGEGYSGVCCSLVSVMGVDGGQVCVWVATAACTR